MTNRVTTTTSFSRLDLYNVCPSKYHHKYIAKTNVVTHLEEPLIKGSLAHTLIEYKLENLNVEVNDILELVIREWLEKIGIPITDEICVQQNGLAVHLPSIVEYAEKVSDLLLKSTEKYTEADAIRNNDGSVPKDVFNYPPKAWKVAYKELNVDDIRYAVDIAAGRLIGDLQTISISKVVAEAAFLAKNLTIPSWFGSTIAIEYRFEQQNNAIYIDMEEELEWTGGIDWIVESINGATVIIDHKSSKKLPSPVEVLWHPQLNLYVELYKQQTGIIADYIGINHLYSGNIVLAEVDLAIVADTINYYETLQKQIDNSLFTRRIPTSYNSPCVRRDYNSNKITQVCPYLEYCWYNFYQDIKEEIAC